MYKVLPLLALLILPFLGLKAQYTLDSTTLTADTLVDNIDVPWEVKWGPDDWVWYTERYGRISRVDPDSTGGIQILLDHSSTVWQDSESGMLGFDFHPQFPDSAYIYVAYTYLDGNTALERISRFTFDTDTLINEVYILDDIPANTTHDGCRILITDDGYLYATLGDEQNQNAPQDVNELNGKVIRLHLDGSIPADNPISGNPVWSWGHRNTQGLELHPDNGMLYYSEHGPQNDDEFGYIMKGGNYGWPEVHGYCDSPTETQFCTDSNVIEPLIAWTPTIATSDIRWYNHPAIPEWENTMLLTVLKDKELISIHLNASGDSVVNTNTWFENQLGRLRDVELAPDGRVIIATNGQSWSNSDPFTHEIIVFENEAYVAPPDTTDTTDTTDSLTALLEPVGTTLNVYPNPAQGHVQVQLQQHKGTALLQLTDLNGQLIIRKETDRELTRLQTAHVAPGLYLLQVNTKEGTLVKKVFIE